MAKTTADVTLVRGAAAMGKASMPADLSGLDKIIDKGNEMQDEIGVKIEAEQTRRKELNDKVKKDAEEVILNSGSLGKGIYDATFSKMEGLQDAYATAVQNGDEKTRLDVLRQVQAHSIFIQDHKATRLDYATKIDNNEQSKGIGKENLHAISKIQSQEYEYGENEKGEPIFKFQDTQGKAVEMTQAEYNKLYEPRHYETTTMMAKLLGKVEKGQHSGISAQNEIAQGIDKLDDAGFKAAIADDVMGQSFGSMLEADPTVSKEIAMALGDDDGIIDKDELSNFIDVVTNPDNENFNLEASKTIFKDKLYNSIENKNTKYLAALKKEKEDEERKEKEKNTTTTTTTSRVSVTGNIQLPVPGGEPGEVLEVSSQKVREIEEAVNRAEPNVGITGNFGFYYPKPKGGFVRYDSMEQFMELNGGTDSVEDSQRWLNQNGLKVGPGGGKTLSKQDILTTYEQTDAARDKKTTTTKTTRKGPK
tara:strand:+ start:222 stop:1652 length:1431 start_codon:yes stop_codon:yes gene_type:complete